MDSLSATKSSWFVIAVLFQSAFAWADSPPAEGKGTVSSAQVASQPPAPASEGAFLETIVAQTRLVSEAICGEVEYELKAARTRMANDPAAVEQDLKLMIGRIVQAPELSVEDRVNLRGQLEAALRESHYRSASKEIIDQQLRQEQAGAVDRQRVIGALARKQERVRQLMDRFDSLMDEGRLRLAEESAAARVEELAEDLPLASSATLTSRQTRHHVEALAARVARQKGVVDTLSTAEAALVPQPDDQPITYPAAPIWEQLTLGRRGSAAVDMKRLVPAEAKIRRTLGDQTMMQFVESPLRDVVDYFKDLHGIEIQFDSKALQEARAGEDTPITCNLKEISLRSALRHVLGTMDLAYVVRHEMLLITTPDRAAAELSARVYPIADLVIPIPSTAGGTLGGAVMGNSTMGNGTQGNNLMNPGMNNNMLNPGNMNRGQF